MHRRKLPFFFWFCIVKLVCRISRAVNALLSTVKKLRYISLKFCFSLQQTLFCSHPSHRSLLICCHCPFRFLIMRRLAWRCLRVLLLAGQTIAAARSMRYRSNDSMPINLMSRQDDGDTEFDPDDFSFINRLSAIGDSYSAGIGAGDRLGSIIQAPDPQSGTLSHLLTLENG